MFVWPVIIKKDASGQEVPYLNFARLIDQHTRVFSRTDPVDALQYLLLLSLVGTADAREQTCQFISDLIYESRDFSALLGEVRLDGTKTV